MTRPVEESESDETVSDAAAVSLMHVSHSNFSAIGCPFVARRCDATRSTGGSGDALPSVLRTRSTGASGDALVVRIDARLGTPQSWRATGLSSDVRQAWCSSACAFFWTWEVRSKHRFRYCSEHEEAHGRHRRIRSVSQAQQ